MVLILLIFELASICIDHIIRIYDGYRILIDPYQKYETNDRMTFTSVFLGWILCPYFIYLAVKFYKVRKEK